MPHPKTLLYSLKGEIMKLLFKCNLLNIPSISTSADSDRAEKLIVSLTSYGRRLKDVAPYAIKSLMRQTYKPDIIVLWLDNNWNDQNLPKEIKSLKTKGLQVKYCEDTKSFKKLVPALSEYPNDLIFTADDDIFYPKDTLKRVMNAHNNHPDRIIGVRGYELSFDDKSGILRPYNEWSLLKKGIAGNSIVLTGGAGCLYQSKLLHSDVTNVQLFRNLSPNADDIWFFFMEYLAGSSIEIISICKRNIIPIDSFYQFFHKNSSLASSNCGLAQNDIQIRAIMSHYGIDDDMLSRNFKYINS